MQQSPCHQLAVLLDHVAKGEQHQAEIIIKIHPELLFEPGNTNDLAGHTFVNYSPVQLARYTHDVDMLNMMMLYLDQAKDDKEKFVTILKEADDECKNQEPYNFKKLINNLNFYDEDGIAKETSRFKEYVRPKEISHIKSFNMQDLLEAYAIYISTGKSTSKYTTWDNSWDIEQRLFLLYNVISPLQNLLPACYVQVPRHKKNMGESDWLNLNLLYQTKISDLLKLTQQLKYQDQEQEQSICSCSLM